MKALLSFIVVILFYNEPLYAPFCIPRGNPGGAYQIPAGQICDSNSTTSATDPGATTGPAAQQNPATAMAQTIGCPPGNTDQTCPPPNKIQDCAEYSGKIDTDCGFSWKAIMFQLGPTMAKGTAGVMVGNDGSKAACQKAHALQAVLGSGTMLRLIDCKWTQSNCNKACDHPKLQYYADRCRSSAMPMEMSAMFEGMNTANSLSQLAQCQDAFEPPKPEDICNPEKNPNACNLLQCGCYCPNHPEVPNCKLPACARDDAGENPMCPQYCMVHPEDVARCPKTDTGINTGTATGTQDDGNDTFGSLLPPPTVPGPEVLPPGGDDEAAPLYTGNGELRGAGPVGAANDAPVTGGSGLNAGAYPGGAQGNGDGKEDPNLKTDIGNGFYGGGSGFGVSSVPLASGGGGGMGSGNDKDKFDLSKFLPGAEKDPKRDPASDKLLAEGITGANDLSNFEKVTRMMNKKRPAFKPAEDKIK